MSQPRRELLQRYRHWHRLRHSLGHSIHGRLVGLFMLLALCSSAVFFFGMQRVLANGWHAYAKPLATDYVDRLAAELGSPPDVERAQALVQRLPITIAIQGPQVRWSSGGGRERQRGGVHEDEIELDDEDGRPLSLVRQTADGHLVRFGLAAMPGKLRPRIVGWLTLGALLLLTGVAYASVRRLMAPLGPIVAGVEAYGNGDFSRPIALRRRDELGALGAHIDGMADKLRGMLEAKRALLLAISHELRSPLTRARINAELVDEGPARDALLRDLAEMRELITDLLESERLAQGHAALNREPLDLAALAREVVQAQPGAHAVAQAVALELSPDIAPLQADAARLRLALRNLLANALRHTPPGAPPPGVFLRRAADGSLALGVRDFGEGVPAEQLAQLGQAFYRPDSARTRSSGGVGLGLYLCRLVAQAHGAELRLRRAEPGLEAALVWPPSAG